MKKIIISLSLMILALPIIAFANIKENDLFCSPSTSIVSVNELSTFTVSSTTIKVTKGNEKQMNWSALSADSSFQSGGYTFTTSWQTPGNYTVIVAYNGNGRVTDSCSVTVTP
jgi:hypothetical protein